MSKSNVPSRWGAKTEKWVQDNDLNTATEKTKTSCIFAIWYLLRNGIDCKTKAIAAQASTYGIKILPFHLVHAKRMIGAGPKRGQGRRNLGRQRNEPTSRAFVNGPKRSLQTHGSTADSEDYVDTPRRINSSEDVDSVAVEALETAATYHETRAATLRATAEALQPDFGSL
jgi:hypothetical protein